MQQIYWPYLSLRFYFFNMYIHRRYVTPQREQSSQYSSVSKRNSFYSELTDTGYITFPSLMMSNVSFRSPGRAE